MIFAYLPKIPMEKYGCIHPDAEYGGGFRAGLY
jgi:hypothetical protein